METTFISPGHLSDLAESGIDATIAQQLGICSVNGPTLKRYGYSGGLTDDDGFQYLLFPYCDPWGEPITWEDKQGKTYPFARVKLPEDKRHGKQKYSQPKGSPICAYIPHALGDFCNTFGIGKDGAETGRAIRGDFYITEGEKKAIAATLAGKPCLGIGGVQSYKALWVQEFALNCRSMTIIFDSDIWSNPKISDALASFGGWLWHVQQHWFIKSQIVPAMDEQAADDWQNTHGDSVPTTMLPEVPRCYELGWDALTRCRFYFGLLPLGYQSEKLGIDDYLMAGCNAGLRSKILSLHLPLLCGDRVLFNLDTLWDVPPVKRSVIVDAEGDGKTWYWDGRKAVAKTKDTKVTEMRREFLVRWPQAKARDLVALLVVATLDFNGLITGDLSWRWRDQFWQEASGVEVQNSCGLALSLYGVSDGNTGIDRLIQRHTVTWLQGALPESDYIGLQDCDLNTFDGTEAPIHPKNFSQYRVSHIRKAGAHPLWSRAIDDLFGELGAVFWSTLRVGLASPRARGMMPYFPCIIGKAGIGKSAIMRVLSEGLGGLVQAQQVTDLYANNANRGYVPLTWLRSRLIYDDDFKCQGRIPSEAIALLNKITTASAITCRAMNKDPVVLPCSINMIVLSNKIPVVSGNDAEGFHRRFLPLTCQDVSRGSINPDWHTDVIRGELPAILASIFDQRLGDALVTLASHAQSDAVQGVLRSVVQASHDDVAEWAQAVWDGSMGRTPAYLEGWDAPQIVTEGDALVRELPPSHIGWLPLAEAHVSYSRFCKLSNVASIPKNKSHFEEAIVRLGGQRPEGTVRRWLKVGNSFAKRNVAMIQLPPARDETQGGDED